MCEINFLLSDFLDSSCFFSLSGLEIHFAEIENDLMTLSVMLKSPHTVEFTQQMEDWAQSLQDLGKVDIQKKKEKEMWTFSTKCRNMIIVSCFAFQY